jgi:general secretion pathway protein G
VKVAVLTISMLSFSCHEKCQFLTRPDHEAALRHDLFEMRKAIDDFYADKQRYPENLEELMHAHYLRAVPVDPLTGRSETWIQIRASGGGDGVIDVRTGAEGTGCDGTEYQSW